MRGPLFGIEGADTRNYVFASDGVWKIPKRMIDRMVFPQYADTKQKILDVLYWRRGSAIKVDFSPTLMAFDADGRWDRAYSVQGAMAVLEATDIKTRAMGMTIACLGPVIDAKKRAEAHRWEPTQDELDRVMLDLLGGNHPRRRHIPYIRPVQHAKAIS